MMKTIFLMRIDGGCRRDLAGGEVDAVVVEVAVEQVEREIGEVLDLVTRSVSE